MRPIAPILSLSHRSKATQAVPPLSGTEPDRTPPKTCTTTHTHSQGPRKTSLGAMGALSMPKEARAFRPQYSRLASKRSPQCSIEKVPQEVKTKGSESIQGTQAWMQICKRQPLGKTTHRPHKSARAPEWVVLCRPVTKRAPCTSRAPTSFQTTHKWVASLTLSQF